MKYADRRSFLKTGALAFGAMGLPNISIANELAIKSNKSVVWLWLGGGATHIELFNPIPDAPSEFRSITGNIQTSIPGIDLGGLLPSLSQRLHKLNIIRSFTHTTPDHSKGTHWVLTGYQQPGQAIHQTNPSIGSVICNYYGINNNFGIPNYIRKGKLEYDGPAWLGSLYSPFDCDGQAVNDFSSVTDLDRLNERYELLSRMDRNPSLREKLNHDMSDMKETALNIVNKDAKSAFDLSKESPALKEVYGTGLGESLLLAKRLIQHGTRFISIDYPGWDNHTDLSSAMHRLCPPLDKAVSAFIDNIENDGMNKEVLLIITSEFGRTPKLNVSNSRDHWPGLGNLVFYGGKYDSGRIIGQSDYKATEPKDSPIYPVDILATIFDHMEIPQNIQKIDSFGRPTNLNYGGKIII